MSISKSKHCQLNSKCFSNADRQTTAAAAEEVEAGAVKAEVDAAEAEDKHKEATAQAAVVTTPAATVKSQDICKRFATPASGPERRKWTHKANLTRTAMKWITRTRTTRGTRPRATRGSSSSKTSMIGMHCKKSTTIRRIFCKRRHCAQK